LDVAPQLLRHDAEPLVGARPAVPRDAADVVLVPQHVTDLRRRPEPLGLGLDALAHGQALLACRTTGARCGNLLLVEQVLDGRAALALGPELEDHQDDLRLGRVDDAHRLLLKPVASLDAFPGLDVLVAVQLPAGVLAPLVDAAQAVPRALARAPPLLRGAVALHERLNALADLLVVEVAEDLHAGLVDPQRQRAELARVLEPSEPRVL